MVVLKAIVNREILMDALKTFVNEPFQKKIYEKENNAKFFFDSFFSHVKTFLKQFVDNCSKSTH